MKHAPMHNCAIIVSRFACILLLALLLGCATSNQTSAPFPTQKSIAIKNTPGILILHGEPFDSDVKDIKLSSFLFTASMSFSDRLQVALEKRGIPTQIFTFRDRNADVRSDMTQILKEKKREGLIQVSVYLTGSNQQRQIAIGPAYNPLKPTPDGSLLVQEGISEKFIVFDSTDPRKANESLAALADSFAAKIASRYFR